MNIYVGNMPYAMTEDELRAAFEAYGKVDAVRVVSDPIGAPRRFGRVVFWV